MEPTKQNEKVILIREDIENQELGQEIDTLLEERAYLEGLLKASSAHEGPHFDREMRHAESRLKMVKAELEKLESEKNESAKAPIEKPKAA